MALRSVGSTFASLASRRFSSAAAAASAAPAGEIGVLDFLKSVGKGVDVHAEKIAKEVGGFQELLVTRTRALKKLGISCKQRKLILRYTQKCREGVWKPKVATTTAPKQ
ncbi:hypothetical protein O6H91_14G078400 [Diphasiastrum complanatum]|uniref:Uncharacterized protein n=1 Tax=Diphasiastrum complanatum TaxID=34168 RepID=A0ACC2BR60_DIPCM|nr:hypothetical protein O6H91_14G078400 [Diphasiastrum complanatum]